jgi:hypothetical protein
MTAGYAPGITLSREKSKVTTEVNSPWAMINRLNLKLMPPFFRKPPVAVNVIVGIVEIGAS